MSIHCTHRSIGAASIAVAPLVFFIEPARHWTESRMATHMLLQFPLLIASGVVCAKVGRPGMVAMRWFDRIDAHGMLGASLASCVLAYWMVPTALDLALLDVPWQTSKYLSLWSAGFALARSARRIADEVALFVVGTFTWMMATAGLLYQTLPQRLCVNYLLDDQRWTGIGLVTAAVLLGTTMVMRLIVREVSPRRGRRPDAAADANGSPRVPL